MQQYVQEQSSLVELTRIHAAICTGTELTCQAHQNPRSNMYRNRAHLPSSPESAQLSLQGWKMVECSNYSPQGSLLYNLPCSSCKRPRFQVQLCPATPVSRKDGGPPIHHEVATALKGSVITEHFLLIYLRSPVSCGLEDLASHPSPR